MRGDVSPTKRKLSESLGGGDRTRVEVVEDAPKTGTNG